MERIRHIIEDPSLEGFFWRVAHLGAALGRLADTEPPWRADLLEEIYATTQRTVGQRGGPISSVR